MEQRVTSDRLRAGDHTEVLRPQAVRYADILEVERLFFRWRPRFLPSETKTMNHSIRIGTVIAGIATLLAIGIGVPASAGQYTHSSDYNRLHRNDTKHMSAAEKRRWLRLHNRNRYRSGSHAYSGHSHGAEGNWTSGRYGNTNPNNGNHYGQTKSHDKTGHNNDSNGNHRNTDPNQSDSQRNHAHGNSGN